MCHIIILFSLNRIDSLYPGPGKAPRYAQLYVYQPTTHRPEHEQRALHNNLNTEITKNIQAIIDDVNPYAKTLHNAQSMLAMNTPMQNLQVFNLNLFKKKKYCKINHNFQPSDKSVQRRSRQQKSSNVQ